MANTEIIPVIDLGPYLSGAPGAIDRTAEELHFALTTAGFEVTKTVLLKYDPSRSRQATGVSALVLRSLEAISPMIRGQFRILMFGKKR